MEGRSEFPSGRGACSEPVAVVMLTLGVAGSCPQELFFGVTAEEAAANQESQSRVCRVLESLCPPEGSGGTFLPPPTHLNQPAEAPPTRTCGSVPHLVLCPQVSVHGSTCVCGPTDRRRMAARRRRVSRSATAPWRRPADSSSPSLPHLWTLVFLFILFTYFCQCWTF